MFEGAPILDPPLAQDEASRRPAVSDGGALDTVFACPPLTILRASRCCGDAPAPAANHRRRAAAAGLRRAPAARLRRACADLCVTVGASCVVLRSWAHMEPRDQNLRRRMTVKRMTIEEFFAALEKTPRDWRGNHAVPIRRDGRFICQCPLTAVARFGEREGFWTYAGPVCWAHAARALGLSMKDARKIVSAADGHGRLRKRLLAACGLTLEKPSARKGRGN